MMNKSENALQSQKKYFRWIILFVFVFSVAVTYMMMDSSPYQETIKAKVDLPGDKVNPQDLWMTKIENENRAIEQHLKYLEKVVLDEKQRSETKSNENIELRQEIVRLKNEMKANQEIKKDSPLPQAPPSNDPFMTPNNVPSVASRPFRPALKEVVMGKAKKNVLSVSRTIPAGTTVKALLVSSVDAPCGVYSSTNPQPIKLRILDNGHLPKEVIAKLKGGLLIASAYGDISTERVYMRLERLTKVESNGEFIETSVTGYVSGEDGKFGVRGTVVDKSSSMVANAAYSGFFSGVGQFLNTSMISSLSNKCNDSNPVGLDLLQAGGLQGTTTAFDMLADYYIHRAEQIVPVIEVTAGRIVDITFTHQAEIGDLYTKDDVKEIREKSRREANG
jgi:conjugal transfer pilus assembly protein TraB